ncbi:hypothetical protein QUF50_01270 [Thiotrichales bacterium HSG1]|nr:hypothetical protein [Thiotrichales bacterium HSG1]
MKKQAKNKEIISGISLTQEERQELSKDFEQESFTFIAGPPVRYGNFFGREEIIQNLFNLWKAFPMQNAAIYGEKRIGKTSLLLYLKDIIDNPKNSRFRKEQQIEWLSKSEQYCFIYVNFQDTDYHTPKGLLEYILQNMKLEKSEGLNLSLSEERPLSEFGRILSGHLIRPTIILMDEIGVVLERHSDKFGNDFWDGLRAIATTKLEPQCLGFVLASHQHPKELVKRLSDKEIVPPSQFFNIFGYINELKEFTGVEARKLIASSPKKISDDNIDFILKLSELKPYLLQILCQMRLNQLRQNENNDNWQQEAREHIEKRKIK